MAIFARLRQGWRSWGEGAFVATGTLWLLYRLFAGLDAHEHVTQFLDTFEYLELDELLLIAALCCPLTCGLLWVQSRRLRREMFRRAAGDALSAIMMSRTGLAPHEPLNQPAKSE